MLDIFDSLYNMEGGREGGREGVQGGREVRDFEGGREGGREGGTRSEGW